MKRFFALLCAILIFCTTVFAAEFSDGKGFRIVDDLGNGYKIVTWDGVSYFKVTDADAVAKDIRNGEPVAWTTKEQEEEYIENETSDSSSSSGSALADVSASQPSAYPSLSEMLNGSDSVYVLSGDMPYDNDTVSGVAVDDMEYVGTQLYSVSPVTSSNASGIKAALLGLLGNYDTIVTVHQYQSSSSGYNSYVTDVQPDYVWLTGAALLLLLIYCLFRLGGALIHG